MNKGTIFVYLLFFSYRSSYRTDTAFSFLASTSVSAVSLKDGGNVNELQGCLSSKCDLKLAIEDSNLAGSTGTLCWPHFNFSMGRMVILKSIHRSTSVHQACYFATSSDHCFLPVGRSPHTPCGLPTVLWERFPYQHRLH